jgi:hypothetical protein
VSSLIAARELLIFYLNVFSCLVALFPSTPDSMAARLRGGTIITSERIIRAKFDTEKRF